MLEIKQIKFDELAQDINFNNLVKEYYEETKLEGLEQKEVRVDIYNGIEARNSLDVFAAYLDSKLIGFSLLVTTILPHYGIQISIVDALFVEKSARGTASGLKLIRASEAKGKERKSPGIIITAPINGPLIDLLPTIKYAPTNVMFFKSLDNEQFSSHA